MKHVTIHLRRCWSNVKVACDGMGSVLCSSINVQNDHAPRQEPARFANGNDLDPRTCSYCPPD